jgi:hypothetical protein
MRCAFARQTENQKSKHKKKSPAKRIAPHAQKSRQLAGCMHVGVALEEGALLLRAQ